MSHNFWRNDNDYYGKNSAKLFHFEKTVKVS